MAALDIGYKPGINKMTEKPKLLFLLGAVSNSPHRSYLIRWQSGLL